MKVHRNGSSRMGLIALVLAVAAVTFLAPGCRNQSESGIPSSEEELLRSIFIRDAKTHPGHWIDWHGFAVFSHSGARVSTASQEYLEVVLEERGSTITTRYMTPEDVYDEADEFSAAFTSQLEQTAYIDRRTARVSVFYGGMTSLGAFESLNGCVLLLEQKRLLPYEITIEHGNDQSSWDRSIARVAAKKMVFLSLEVLTMEEEEDPRP